MTDVRCQCCGVEVTGARAQVQRCPVCDICDGSHGHERHRRLERLVQMGRLSPWAAIASLAFDDAWLAGKLVISPSGDAGILEAPKRWEVLLGWCRCRGTVAPMAAVVDAALAPFQTGDPTPAVLAAAREEVRIALHAWNPAIQVEFSVDFDPEASADAPTVLFEDGKLAPTELAGMVVRTRGSA